MKASPTIWRGFFITERLYICIRMINQLPTYLIITFLASVVLTYQLFINSVKEKRVPTLIILCWTVLVAIIALTGLLTDTSGTPPVFTLVVAPPLIVIFYLLSSKKGLAFVESLDLQKLTLLHIVRIPVE